MLSNPGESPHLRLLEAASSRARTRFGCVIYLCPSGRGRVGVLREECERYVQEIGWRALDVVVEREPGRSPAEREGLQRALDLIRAQGHAALFTPWRSTISCRKETYFGFAGVVEAAGGFVYARNLTGPDEALDSEWRGPMTSPSAVRRTLSRAIAACGVNGAFLVSHDLNESADGPDLPPGSQAYPPCRCPLHRAGQGHSDIVLRQGKG